MLDFPDAPQLDELFPDPVVEGVPQWRWDGARWAIVTSDGGSGGASIIVAPSPPADVPDNTLWWSSTDGKMYLLFNDGNSTQWISVSITGPAGPRGAQGEQGEPGLDGQDGETGPQGDPGLTYVYVAPDPPPNADPDSLWWCTTDGTLYILYADPNSTQWVAASPGERGPQGPPGPPGGARSVELEQRVLALEARIAELEAHLA